MDRLEDLESFLKNVDEISELVKELNTSDAEAQRKAVEKADHYISVLEVDEPCRTKINKTMINTNLPSLPAPASMSPQNNPSVSLENFMKNMERDAEDRRIRRRAKEEKAVVLKDKGNEAYAKEDYETAVKYYSDGLAELRDMQPLYTNRAQAYIKLGKYKEAISDCEWALKCDERCLKAYLHMGKAYLALRNYNESRSCYEKIVEIEPRREKMVKEYLTQVDSEEERDSQERSAREAFDKGEEKATTVPQLLEKLSRPKQTPLYYCGGLELLSQAITDCTGQTLFRLNNGISIISGNDMLKSCLLPRSRESYTQEVCVSVLKLWRVVCNGNDENQKMLMTCPASSQSIVDLLASEHTAVRAECLALLCLYSQMPRGRGLAVDNLNVGMLVKNLMACISNPKHQEENTALTILENFASDSKFCVQLRDVFTESVSVPFAAMLKSLSGSNQHFLPILISTIGCLARDEVIRYNMAHCPECWEAFLVTMKRCSVAEYNEILYPMLGLMFNLSTIPSPVIQEHAVSLCGFCLDLLSGNDGGIVTRAIGVLCTVLPQSLAAVQHVVQGGVVRTLHRLLKGAGQTTVKYAIKTIAVCTAASQLAREELVKSGLSVLLGLLGSSCDEVVSGNAALCLGHCLQVEGTAGDLLGTDVVRLLLRHAAGDARRTDVQRNAAVALGRLCQTEPRHMNQLRELHGLEILHSCMKLIT
ncbi:tetratricopeptide repeat protein 12 isoform 2-T2 [Polymixia lowei]